MHKVPHKRIICPFMTLWNRPTIREWKYEVAGKNKSSLIEQIANTSDYVQYPSICWVELRGQKLQVPKWQAVFYDLVDSSHLQTGGRCIQGPCHHSPTQTTIKHPQRHMTSLTHPLCVWWDCIKKKKKKIKTLPRDLHITPVEIWINA